MMEAGALDERQLGEPVLGTLNYSVRADPEAIEAFKASDALEDMFGGRKTNPSRIYIPRCEHYLDNPPGDDWDGVWTLTSK